MFMFPNTIGMSQIPEIDTIFNQLNAVDFTLAQLAIDLKDPDKRQEIGMRLLDMITYSCENGLELTDIKLKTKAGMATVSLKFPVGALRKKPAVSQEEERPEDPAEDTATPQDTPV